ncbi:Sir2 family NAD-dependent protein deacetylase [Methanobrevibacter sp.]|uniref:Sir2 family NAD-dependent protein deacetylase n=1 Tax=Methanobrevibacter sp. TaxID=66852 RepID=UPI002622F4C9|nr:Sir2 family NAD-dependent protein deacetylase [uncultured Methanobrevibacter sp.]
MGKIKAIITQNVDGLPQKAGSNNVIELHGNVSKNYCINCDEEYNLDYIVNSKNITTCKYCGSIIKPDIVLYQEPLKNEIMVRAIDFISAADLLVVGETFLIFYPETGLIEHFRGDNLVLINKDKTNYDNNTDIVIISP